MKINRIIKNIIYMPKCFSEGNTSIHSLLKESGYFEHCNQITEREIYEILIKHLECIDQWLDFSENKRSSSGWYFIQNESRKYIVGYLSLEMSINETVYSDGFEACAFFIKQEIEEIKNA